MAKTIFLGLKWSNDSLPPTGDAQERFWRGDNSLIRFMLINSMKSQISKLLLYAAIVKDLWVTT